MRTVSQVAIFLVAVTVAGCDGGGEDAAETEGAATQSEAVAAEEEAAARRAALVAKAKQLIPIARQSQMGESRKESLRIADAQAKLLAIAAKEPSAIAPLTAALEKPDYELIVDLHSFYIQLGQKGSEKVLIEALNSGGFTPETSPMAFAFLASGNTRLIRGTRAWADRNGLTITGSGGFGPKWGSVGLPAPEIPVAPPPAPPPG